MVFTQQRQYVTLDLNSKVCLLAFLSFQLHLTIKPAPLSDEKYKIEFEDYEIILPPILLSQE